ncbi:hypothetical protein ACM1RC_31795, partial [Paenibacillus azoreducens]|uniref:hypothetical protein n=1 Tax=Paenibacillus azoreducens TaxID=116718 RepID=UPI0039F58831
GFAWWQYQRAVLRDCPFYLSAKMRILMQKCTFIRAISRSFRKNLQKCKLFGPYEHQATNKRRKIAQLQQIIHFVHQTLEKDALLHLFIKGRQIDDFVTIELAVQPLSSCPLQQPSSHRILRFRIDLKGHYFLPNHVPQKRKPA